MDFIYFYILFAVTTALVAIYELFWPVISQLKVTHKELPVIEHSKITVVTFFVLSLIVAPLLIPACLIPSKGESFRKSLAMNLEKSI